MSNLKRISYKLNDLTVLKETPISLLFPTAPNDFGHFTEISESDIISVIFKDGTITAKEELKGISKYKNGYIFFFEDWSCSLNDLHSIILYTYKYNV